MGSESLVNLVKLFLDFWRSTWALLSSSSLSRYICSIVYESNDMDIASYAIANTPYICSEESAVSYKQQRMKQII